MKEKSHKFCEKFLAGNYSVKVGEQKYLGFPKIAPIMTIGIPMYGFGEYLDRTPLIVAGAALTAIGLFGFFYYNIFPSRKPVDKK